MSLTGNPQLTTDAPIVNDGFWPDVLVSELLTDYRVPSEYDEGVVKTGLTLAIVRVNRKLSAGKDAVKTEHADLAAFSAAIDNDMVDGEYTLIHWYKQAVFCSAKAFLLQQFNSLNRRKNAENAAKEAPETEEYWLDQAQHAIFYLMQALKPDEPVPADYATHVALI